jgi:hypothetical protein
MSYVICHSFEAEVIFEKEAKKERNNPLPLFFFILGAF